MKRISTIHRIEMKEENSWVYPVFTDEYGHEWRPKLTGTGACWALSWEKFMPQSAWDESKEYAVEPVPQKSDNVIEELRSLVDGALPIIEIFKDESPAQTEWKKRWIKRARELS